MTSTAQLGLLILLSVLLLLHISILLRIIPYKLIWGGRLKSATEMIRFEIFSILVNSLFICVVLAQAGFCVNPIPNKIITYALGLMTALFLLNTLGNAFSKNKIEQMVFTPVTIVLAVFSLILALTN